MTAVAGAEPLDAVVVGGGIAGLAAAWRLRDRRIVLLEAGDRLGGRLRSDPHGDYWLNYGAHLFPGPGTRVGQLVDELGLELVPVTGATTALALGDVRLLGGRVESYPLRLPLAPRERVALVRAGLRIRRAVAGYRRVAAPRAGETPAARRARMLAHRDELTFAQFLGELPPTTRAILDCAVRRSTADADELTAGCAIGLFASVWAGRGALLARNLVGGAGALPAALGRELGARAQVGACVERIVAVGRLHDVAYSQGSELHRVRARHVIVAAPAPQAAPLVRELAPRAAAALAQLRYGGFVSVAVATGERGPMPWDDVYAMATPGRAFGMFTNQAQALRGAGPRQPGGSLMLFAGGADAATALAQSDDVVRERFLADLHDLFPQTRGIVVDARVRRWPLGNPFASPGRRLLQAPLEGALGARGGVHLAGDYFAELGSMEVAASTGWAAAERVAGALDGHAGDYV